MHAFHFKTSIRAAKEITSRRTPTVADSDYSVRFLQAAYQELIDKGVLCEIYSADGATVFRGEILDYDRNTILIRTQVEEQVLLYHRNISLVTPGKIKPRIGAKKPPPIREGRKILSLKR